MGTLSRLERKKKSKLINYLTIFGIINSIDLALFPFASKSKAIAQVTPDKTLGTENSVVNSDVDSQKILIKGGATRGQNLFHSFEEFNIGEGENVYFTNPAGINLILGRVTGTNPSNILGKLGVEGNADLFLLNPHGIYFGANASLDINGSFLATTASSILFEAENQFSATDPSLTPLLTVNVPIGLQFGNRTGSITNKSLAIGSSSFAEGLQVDNGKTLTLVGGDILVEDGLLGSSGGSIELAGIAENERVGLQQTATGWALDYQNTQNFRDISFDKGLLNFGSAITVNDGEIKLQGKHISVKGSSQIGNGVNINLIVNASESVEISGSRTVTLERPGISSLVLVFPSILTTETIDTRQGGNIAINTGKLIVREGGRISTKVTGEFTLDGETISIASGRGGDIVIC